MKKKVNFFCWKIGPVSETVYPTIETEVTAVTFQYPRHPWLQDPWHGDWPYFPCQVFRSERAPIGVWNGTLKI